MVVPLQVAPTVKVNMKFLQHVRTPAVKVRPRSSDDRPHPSDDTRLDEPSSSERRGSHLNATIDKFKAGKFEALNFMSPMGAGKSVLLSKLIREIVPKRVLALMSRVTLAQELENKVRNEGFVSYFLVAPDAQPNLDDEEEFPRVICQLNSIRRLCPALLRVFDLVIMDEACSLLLHFSAGTLRNRGLVLETLQTTLRHAGRIIAMDALWGKTEHCFLDKLATPERVKLRCSDMPVSTSTEEFA